MGYYTYHKLTIEPKDEKLLAQIITAIESESYEVRQALAGDSESMKWYSHDEDMRELSKKWPNVIFHLEGEGEDNEDIWVATYQNGRCHHRHAKIVIDPFDPEKLE